MAEISEDLLPTDGLSNANISFAGLDAVKGTGAATLRFDLFGADEAYVGTVKVVVGPQPDGTVDAMITDGHRQLKDILRQWLFRADRYHQHLQRRTSSGTSAN